VFVVSRPDWQGAMPLPSQLSTESAPSAAVVVNPGQGVQVAEVPAVNGNPLLYVPAVINIAAAPAIETHKMMH